MALQAKILRFTAGVDAAGRISAEGGDELELPEGWQAEHLVLAGLVRCSLTSLRFHARRAGVEVRASGSARGAVTAREEDGRYAFVEIECDLRVELDPLPDDLPRLLKRAENGCFVGASLTAKPVYRWTVNGSPASPV